MPSDQLPVPAQKRPRRHNPHPQQIPRQRRQHEPVLRLQQWTSHLPTQHRHLMTQDQQLDVLRRLTTPTDHDERQQQSEDRRKSAEQHHDDHAGPEQSWAG
jgi:hypothetical protein